MSLKDLTSLAGLPGFEPAVGELFKLYESTENIKVYKDQCKKLRNNCTDLLLALRDDGTNVVDRNHTKAVDEAKLTIERISDKVHTWSTWGKLNAIFHQSEIKQGLDELNGDLVRCASHFDILSKTNSLRQQRETSRISHVLGNASPLCSSPIAIPSHSNKITASTQSPISLTPSTDTQSTFFPQSVSTSSSFAQPSTSGSNVSRARGHFHTDSQVQDSTPAVSPPVYNVNTRGKSVSRGAARSRRGRKTRPWTAPEAEGNRTRLYRIGESHSETSDEGEPHCLSSSLPSSFVAPVEHTSSRPAVDIAPWEGSENFSVSSGHLPMSDSNEDLPEPAPMYLKYGSDEVVEAGTLRGLVGRLIFDSSDFRKDMQFKKTFLASYQAFSNAEEVFNLLIERFEAVSSPKNTPEQHASVTYSVLTVFDLWLRSCHVKDIPLLSRMRGFAISIQRSFPAHFGVSAQRLTELIDIKMNIIPSPDILLPPCSIASSLKFGHGISEIPPEALALALTMLESDHYQQITASDCMTWLEGIPKDSWGSGIADNSKLSYWAQKCVLEPDQKSQRIENLQYFICVIEECRKRRNFSSTCTLAEALSTSAINDLKGTDATLDKSRISILEEVDRLRSTDGNFAAYRTALNASTEPCVPWLNVHLIDLEIIYRAHPPFVEQDRHTNLINFRRYHCVHERIRHILSYKYSLTKPSSSSPHAGAHAFLDGLRSIVTDTAFKHWLQDRTLKLTREGSVQNGQVARDQELATASSMNSTIIKSRQIPPPDLASFSRTRIDTPMIHHTEFQSAAIPPQPQSSKIPSGTRHEEPGTGASLSNTPLNTTVGRTHHVFHGNFLEDPTPASLGSSSHRSQGRDYEDAFSKSSDRCLDGRITRLCEHTVAFGGFADVSEGFIGSQKVAIKTIRPFSGSGKRIEESKLRKRLRREYLAWSCLSHPNVVQCLGFSHDFSPSYVFPSLISPWMSNGSVFPYLEKNPTADRLDLLLGVARGLRYLHDRRPSIIHGDLRAGNILVSDFGIPCLSDFGLSRVLQVEEMTATSELAGSLRWMAPELLIDHIDASPSSDVWAYGMTVLEILSGHQPYHEFKKDAVVFGRLKDGNIPSRPQDTKLLDTLSNQVWDLCLRCWILNPTQRPSMQEITSTMKRYLRERGHA